MQVKQTAMQRLEMEVLDSCGGNLPGAVGVSPGAVGVSPGAWSLRGRWGRIFNNGEAETTKNACCFKKANPGGATIRQSESIRKDGHTSISWRQ